MTTPQMGSIQLDRTVESIVVGTRHRADLGDIDVLADSIARHGLLQPVTVTVDGVLVCGARRLAAIKQLGWRTVNVWVRAGLSDRLGRLLAEQDDNQLHKPLTQREAAALYRELKQLMAEDAARRKAATQFTERQQENDGPAKFAGPSGALGDAREQAAAMIPGGASHATLEKVGYLERLASDNAQPDALRAEAAAGLEQIEAGAAVHPIYRAIREAADAAQQEREAELHELADEALARAGAEKKTKRTSRPPRPRPVPEDDREPARYPVRAFVMTWGELNGWWEHYDAASLAGELTDEQIGAFLDTVEGTSRFADKLRAARELSHAGAPDTSRPHLRAL